MLIITVSDELFGACKTIRNFRNFRSIFANFQSISYALSCRKQDFNTINHRNFLLLIKNPSFTLIETQKRNENDEKLFNLLLSSHRSFDPTVKVKSSL